MANDKTAPTSKDSSQLLSNGDPKILSENEEPSNKKSMCDDFWKTLPLKLVVFCFSGGAICIFPFQVLQMQLLGISIKEIALLYLINPIASLLGPIVAGLIADRTGKFGLVFLSNVILAAVAANFLLLVPPVDTDNVYINCNPDASLSLKVEKCNDCMRNLQYDQTSLKVHNCQPCDSEEVETEMFCATNSTTTYECPALNQEFDTVVNITNPYSSGNNSCIFDVFHINQENLTFESVPICSSRRFCDFKCTIKTNTEECGNKTYNISKSFVIYGTFFFIANFFFAAAFTMMDASILAYAKENNLEIGKQRIMVMFGFGFTPILAGVLIDVYSKKIGETSYLPAFLLADVLFVIGGIIISQIELKGETSDSNVFKGLGKLISRIEVDAFLLVVLILGCNFGFIESYLFIYIKSLGAPGFLLGLTMTVGCLSSVPMLFYAEWFENKIGRQNVFLLCFTAYAARMIGYSFIKDPWMCLIFETLEAFTYQLLWVTCLKLCPLLAPKGLLATMTGVCGAVHYSFGRGVGGFLGGFVIDAYGIRIAFRIFGGIAFCGSIVYLIIHHTILKKKIAYREKELKEDQLKAEEDLSNEEKKNQYIIEESQGSLRHSLMCLTGSGLHLSPTGSKYKEVNTEKEMNLRQREMQNMNSSVPHLHGGDILEFVGSIKNISRSTGNLWP